MGRPKTYDRDAALKLACEAFWAHGYGQLGVRALEIQTGLNQFAIRTDFGGKEGLYVEALRFYIDLTERQALAPMKTAGVDSIAAFFRSLVSDGSPTSSAWGCLVVNSGIENAEVGSSRVQAVASAYWRTLGDHFSAALRRSLDRGEVVLDVDGDVDELSGALVVAVMGVHTANRAAADNVAGAPLVTVVLRLIDSWKRRTPASLDLKAARELR